MPRYEVDISYEVWKKFIMDAATEQEAKNKALNGEGYVSQDTPAVRDVYLKKESEDDSKIKSV